MPEARPVPSRASTWLYIALLAVVVLAGAFFRLGGLFRGLGEKGYVYHPDAPKQVQALERFLDGRYVWYAGSWFYDGYPYGLNHVDAFILRPVLATRDAAARLLRTDRPPAWSLYHWARLLRVLYGMLCIAAVYAVCRLFRLPRGATLFAVAAVAFSPLAISVAHTATGDIGVDLFVSLAMVALALHGRYPARMAPVLAIAVCSGMAFSCKYHGILALMWVPMVLGLEALHAGRSGRMLLHGFAALPAAVAGILLLKPELLIDFDRSWAHMVNNFVKIKDYNVSEAFKALPLSERLARSWGHNLPRLADAFQVLLLLLVALGVLISVWRLVVALRRRAAVAPSAFCREAAAFALFSFPFVVMVLAVSGKPKLHPFHFSFVVPVLAVGGALLASTLGRRVRAPRLQLLGAIPFVAVLVLMARDASRDHFFWIRDDNKWVADTFSPTVLETPFRSEDKRGIKLLELEPESPSVFRNRHLWSIGRAPGLSYMKDMRALPLPETPYPLRMDYLFCNGPLFLRSDRMFHAACNAVTERVLVFTNPPPASLTIGVRSFANPVAFTVRAGTRTELPVLAPHSQVITTIPASGWQRSAYRYTSDHLWLLPLKILAGAGDGVVTVLETDADQERFRVFGGQQLAYPGKMLRDHRPESVLEAVSGQRFGFWQNAGSSQRHRFPLVLAAGRYRVRLQVTAPSACEVALDVIAENGDRYIGDSAGRIALQPGRNTIEVPFVKPFAPLKVTIQGVCEEPVLLDLLEVKPDAEALFADFAAWSTGTVPAWAAAGTEPDESAFEGVARTAHARFGDVVEFRDIRLQAVVPPGERTVAVAMRADLPERALKRLGEFTLFLHLYDADKRQRYAGSSTLAAVFGADVPRQGITFTLPPDLPAGTYQARIGIWNSRTRLNTRPRRESLFTRPPSALPIGEIVIR